MGRGLDTGREGHGVRTLIVNGTVVNANGSSEADVLVDGETIALVGRELPARGITADRTIDATGKYVIPGAVDVHTHFDMPMGPVVSKDTFETGTRAAAFGGTTTIIDFAPQDRGHTLREALDAWHSKAEGHCAIDYGFHVSVSDVNDRTLAEMDGLVAEGVTDFKVFTAYPGRMYSDDAAILRTMQRAAESGALVMVHAENGIAIDVLMDANAEGGRTAPWFHGLSRPAGLEAEAANRVIRLAEVAGSAVYIVHLSSRDALEAVEAGRARGAAAYAETCPQYLFLSLDDLGNGFEGAKFVCSPPLRPKDHQAALWDGLRRDSLQVVATDHCPFDFHGQKDLGRDDFRKIPNGLPTVEDRLDLLHDGGVVGGRISRERWVEIASTAPARMFGLAGRKGVVAPGADADLVVYDPARRHVISATTHHMAVDYSCFEGRTVQGGSDVVMSRGRVIVDHGRYTGRPGDGRFLRRAPTGAALRRGAL